MAVKVAVRRGHDLQSIASISECGQQLGDENA
jgi:hypothetical protein